MAIDNIYEFYKNGQLRSVRHYKYGVPHGQWTWWYKNGQMERMWLHTWKGMVKEEKEYNEDGRRIKCTEWFWHWNGQLKSEWRIVDAKVKKQKICTEEREWWESGRLKSERTYDDDFPDWQSDGIQLEWNENGVLTSEYHFVNKKQEGIQWYLNENGIKEVWYCKNGKAVASGERAQNMIAKVEKAAARQIVQAEEFYKIDVPVVINGKSRKKI